jgi:hypothetical protein
LAPKALLPANLKLYQHAMSNYSPTPVNSFIKRLYLPSNESITLAVVLDEQPLKRLIKYVYVRSLAKIIRKE